MSLTKMGPFPEMVTVAITPADSIPDALQRSGVTTFMPNGQAKQYLKFIYGYTLNALMEIEDFRGQQVDDRYLLQVNEYRSGKYVDLLPDMIKSLLEKVVEIGVHELEIRALDLFRPLWPSEIELTRRYCAPTANPFMVDMSNSNLRTVVIRDCQPRGDFMLWFISGRLEDSYMHRCNSYMNSQLRSLKYIIVNPIGSNHHGLAINEDKVISGMQHNYNLLDVEFIYDPSNINFEWESGAIIPYHKNTLDIVAQLNARVEPYTGRNKIASQKCKDAVYIFLCINRYKKDHICSKMGRDIIFLISRLVHVTIGTKIWV